MYCSFFKAVWKNPLNAGMSNLLIRFDRNHEYLGRDQSNNGGFVKCFLDKKKASGLSLNPEACS